MWSTEEGNGNILHYPGLKNSMGSIKRQKYMTLENESARSICVQHATGEEQRAIMVTSVRTMQLGPRGNDSQLWMCLAVKIKSDTIKNSIT